MVIIGYSEGSCLKVLQTAGESNVVPSSLVWEFNSVIVFNSIEEAKKDPIVIETIKNHGEVFYFSSNIAMEYLK
jgi:hypothetical protein